MFRALIFALITPLLFAGGCATGPVLTSEAVPAEGSGKTVAKFAPKGVVYCLPRGKVALQVTNMATVPGASKTDSKGKTTQSTQKVATRTFTLAEKGKTYEADHGKCFRLDYHENSLASDDIDITIQDLLLNTIETKTEDKIPEILTEAARLARATANLAFPGAASAVPKFTFDTPGEKWPDLTRDIWNTIFAKPRDDARLCTLLGLWIIGDEMRTKGAVPGVLDTALTFSPLDGTSRDRANAALRREWLYASAIRTKARIDMIGKGRDRESVQGFLGTEQIAGDEPIDCQKETNEMLRIRYKVFIDIVDTYLAGIFGIPRIEGHNPSTVWATQENPDLTKCKGICHRLPHPILIGLFHDFTDFGQAKRKGGGGEEGKDVIDYPSVEPVVALKTQLPNGGYVAQLDITRKPCVQNTAKVVFKDGILKQYKVINPSTVLGCFKVPFELLNAAIPDLIKVDVKSSTKK